MRMRVIHFVPDMPRAERFYEALGLRADVRSRTGMWVELSAAGGELDLHDSASAAGCTAVRTVRAVAITS
jgi:catechol 2,3-dioxygenase-like lactoylglutathione lyase family enzyme